MSRHRGAAAQLSLLTHIILWAEHKAYVFPCFTAHKCNRYHIVWFLFLWLGLQETHLLPLVRSTCASFPDCIARHCCKQPLISSMRVSDNLLLQVIEKPTAGLFWTLFTWRRRGWWRTWYSKAAWAEIVGYKILRAERRVHSKISSLDFRRADYGLVKDLLGRIPWDKALEWRGMQGSWRGTFRKDM